MAPSPPGAGWHSRRRVPANPNAMCPDAGGADRHCYVCNRTHELRNRIATPRRDAPPMPHRRYELSDIPGDVEAPRRRFIKSIAGVAAVIPIHALATAPVAGAAASALPVPPAAASAPAPAPVVPDGYQFFSAEEAAFVEAVV